MADEQTVYGVKAALALLECRPSEVLRIFYRAERLAQLKGILAWAARQHLPYREVDEQGLRRLADSPHHEGLVVVARPLRYRALEPGMLQAPPPAGAQTRGPAAGSGCWLALDGVANPHNLGALLRTAAFFGMKGVLVGGVSAGTAVNGAVLRVAEGAAERLLLCAAPALPDVLEQAARQGLPALGLETDAPAPLAPGSAQPPWLLLLGNEQEGLSPAVRARCSAVYGLRGPGGESSLNVSVAAAVALAWLLPPPAPDWPLAASPPQRPAPPHRPIPPRDAARRGHRSGSRGSQAPRRHR